MKLGKGRVFPLVLLMAAAWGQTAFAQQAVSSVAGAVRTTASEPIPAAVVQAVSPELGEARSAATDVQGRYTIAGLPPGAYSVVVKAAGFTTVRVVGIDLPAGFAGTLNVSLTAGDSAREVTIASTIAQIDIRTTAQQNVVTGAMAASGRDASAAVTVTRGLSQAAADVGGAAGAYAAQGNNLTVRGKAGVKRLFDGLRVENAEAIGNTSYMINSATVDQTVVETGGGSAESMSAGGSINNVPKSGTNTFAFRISGLISTERMQGDNLDDELRARGLTAVNKVGNIWDATATAGGPIKKDRLWFFTAPKAWGNRNYAAGIYWNKTQGTPVYTPDLQRRGDQYEYIHSYPVRLTWQASRRNKLASFTDFPQKACTCRPLLTTTAPEAGVGWVFGRKGHIGQMGLFQGTWTSPRTDRLLLEAGGSFAVGGWPMVYQPTVTADHISITDIGLGFTWNDKTGPHRGLASNPVNVSDRLSERFTMSYVAGAHTLKFGVSAEHVWHESFNYVNHDVNYTFLNGQPNALTQFSTPYTDRSRVNVEVGIFAQDQWTTGRLTVNYGVRYSYFNAGIPRQHAGPTRFVPFARDFAPVPCVPCWHDLDPRLGASFDLFGKSRTAMKASFGRYVNQQVLAIANANNPFATSVDNVTRTWDDANRNYVPDCDLRLLTGNGECGAVSNAQFGSTNPNATRYADDVIRGFRARDYVWDLTVELQHQLTRALSVTGGYYRNWAANFSVTDNHLVAPSDFTPYCVTAPSDPRLPNGGGFQVCGLYDLVPAKFGQVQNLIAQAERFGKQTATNDFVGAAVNVRLPSGARIDAGVDTGRSVSDNCFVVDSPQQLRFSGDSYCRKETPFTGNLQVKVNGTYPLPFGLSASANYQNQSGAMIQAVWQAPNGAIRPSLGRNLAACGARMLCTATAAVPLIAPGTMYEERRSQLDVRLSKALKLASGAQLTAAASVFNLFNDNAISSIQTAYGAQWLKPTAVLYSRLAQMSVRVDF